MCKPFWIFDVSQFLNILSWLKYGKSEGVFLCERTGQVRYMEHSVLRRSSLKIKESHKELSHQSYLFLININGSVCPH